MMKLFMLRKYTYCNKSLFFIMKMVVSCNKEVPNNYLTKKDSICLLDNSSYLVVIAKLSIGKH